MVSEISPAAFKLYYRYLDPVANPQVEDFLAQLDQLPRRSLLGSPLMDRGVQGSLMGRLFEWFAYDHLRQSATEDQVILSPDETIQLYGSCYSSRGLRVLSGFNTAIPNISSPDGLGLTRSANFWRLSTVVEYKLGRALDKGVHQVEQFIRLDYLASTLDVSNKRGRQRLGDYLHQLRPELPGYPVMLDHRYRVVYVTAADAPLNQQSLIQTLLATGQYSKAELMFRLAVERVPFSLVDFRMFYQLLIDQILATR